MRGGANIRHLDTPLAIRAENVIAREFLTGFSKRKAAKKEAARARAVEKERLTRLDLRQQVRSVPPYYMIGQIC